MDLVPILSTVILAATLATLVLAVVSYAAFRMRDRRRPTEAPSPPRAASKTFFVRYRPDGQSHSAR